MRPTSCVASPASPDVRYEALVPNVRGAHDAIASKADVLLLVLMASETFNRKNVRMSARRQPGPIRRYQTPRRRRPARRASAPSAPPWLPLRRRRPRGARAGFDRALCQPGLLRSHAGGHDRHGQPDPGRTHRRPRAGPLGRQAPVRSALPQHARHGPGQCRRWRARGITTFDASVAGIGGCPSPPKPPATSRPKTPRTCCTRWATRPASTSTASSKPPNSPKACSAASSPARS